MHRYPHNVKCCMSVLLYKIYVPVRTYTHKYVQLQYGPDNAIIIVFIYLCMCVYRKSF